jgi:hypothetical protein
MKVDDLTWNWNHVHNTFVGTYYLCFKQLAIQNFFRQKLTFETKIIGLPVKRCHLVIFLECQSEKFLSSCVQNNQNWRRSRPGSA